jgi:hypothetical protein
MFSWRAFALVAALLVALPGRASAQGAEQEPGSLARFQFGLLKFTPTVSLTNFGVDNNVFNSPSDPQQDTTGTINPGADFWANVGRSRISGKASMQYVYYNKFDTQRSLGTADTLRWEVPMARVIPFVEGQFSTTKTRVGYEIETRPRQNAENVNLGAEFRLSGKTSIIATGSRTLLTFADGEQFQGTDLSTALDHSTNSERLQLRYRLTSLTTFVAGAEAIQDRFGKDALRSSNSIKILPGFEMQPSALVAGSVYVGYRRLEPLDSSVPVYQGVVAHVDAKLKNGSRLFDIGLNRDLTYSVSDTEPYYALTDIQLALTQRLTYTWDVVARAGWQTLDYHAVDAGLLTAPDPVSILNPSALTTTEPRVDRGRQFGGGIGYRVGRTLRVGFDVNYYRRRSAAIAANNYEGLRLGASVTYGPAQ